MATDKKTRMSIIPTARPPSGKPTRSMRFLLAMARSLQAGKLTVILPCGAEHRFAGAKPGPDARLIVHDQAIARRLLTGGTLGFCEGYLDGQWSSPDIEALFVLALVNEQVIGDIHYGRPLVRAIAHAFHRLRPNSRRGSRRNISYHYDLGNRFYESWLDPSMTYSSALFSGSEAGDAAETCAQGDTLAEGQRRKYAEIARRMGLQPEDHVLEIGCGWGGFAAFAAAEVGARVTAITISRAQYEFASRRIQDMGLNDRVAIELRDYRDTVGQFDRVASIEMIEAVGEGYWPTYFETIRDRLRSGGRAALQVITIDDRYYDSYRRSADYIQKYIFPGGMLPSMTALTQEVARAGMRITDGFGFRQDYARTLREWNHRFQAGWPELRAMGFDDRFKRMWEQYFAYCAAGFEVGCIDVKQIAIARD